MAIENIKKNSLNDIRFNPFLRDIVITDSDFSTVSGNNLYNQNGFIMLGTSVVSILDPTFGRGLQKSIGTFDKNLPLQIWRNMMNADNSSNSTIYFKKSENQIDEEIELSATYPETKPLKIDETPQDFFYNKIPSTYTVLNGQTILDVTINATGVPSIENMREIIDANNLNSLNPVLTEGVELIIPITCAINTNVINQMKNNFQNYPVVDSNFCGTEYLNSLIADLLTKLENV
jgi:hypothetical protein